MRKLIVSLLATLTVACPAMVLAAPSEAVQLIYWSRPDLQAAFDSSTFHAIPGSGAGFLIDLEDWAWQYGWREYPELSAYAPTSPAPVRVAHAAPEPDVTAHAYVVVDRTSGQVLAAQNADDVWPMASLTKLMTSSIVLDKSLPLDQTHNVLASDDVGGAKLYVTSGDTFTLDDLFYSALVASANNAANALSRASGMDRKDFVAEMNRRAQALDLSHTAFVDPTGIETGNVTTAREFSRFANAIFSRKEIRRYTTTAARSVKVLSEGTTKNLKNTDWMLWKPEYDDLYVMAGKTGYLEESAWNFVVCLRPKLDDVKHELLIVVFGADSRADSFVDTRALAEWAWGNYQWN